LLNLVNQKTKRPNNHIIRYWEKTFRQIKPQVINNRRYYTQKQINIIKLIRFLLKDEGMTIKGVKNVLKSNLNKLDDYNTYSLKTAYQKNDFKNKTKNILNKINKLKRSYGKKNTS